MGKFSAYKVDLAGKADGHYEQDFVIDKTFFENMENNDILWSDVHVHMDMDKRNDAYHCVFHCKGKLQIPCDRCLEPMKHEVDSDYELTVKFGDEYNDETDGLLIVPDSDNDLNVASIVYDTVALTIPISHVHEEGECDEATWEALQAHTAHSIADGDEALYGRYADDDGADIEGDAANNDEINESNIDPRWAELLKIKDNNLKNK